MPRPDPTRARDPLRIVAIAITVALHLGVLGGMWLARAAAGQKPPLPTHFVDAQLVRFGKPRDLSFLPHKQGVVKNRGPAPQIKVAREMTALPRLDKEKRPDEIDPLKRTHAEIFKKLDDQPEAVEDTVGAQTGSRAGTASEAKGDPYILSLIDQIGSAWTVPTTIKDAELQQLSADVCLTIAASGELTHYDFTRRSGNSQFDSSLEATLGVTRRLPPPPDRWRTVAARGRLCPSFTKQ